VKKILISFCIFAVLFMGAQLTPGIASELTTDGSAGKNLPLLQTQPLIIDHNTVDITAIPQEWIIAAKNDLHIYYGHTSHGSQLVDGMYGLIDFANNGGLGLSLPRDIFAGLPMTETDPDAGYYPDWVDNTRNYLGTPDSATGRGTDHPETNVVIWSWCGQLSDLQEHELTNQYLLPMTELENDYPGITFVYMTGHSDGSGETGNLHIRNQQIRQYAIENNKVLYDFYDIELYDPDGNYYGNQYATDNCDYDSGNWCTDWQETHTRNLDWYSVECAHSQALNCNQKAYAAWWLWASLAGWNSTVGSTEPAEESAPTEESQAPPESESPPEEEPPSPDAPPVELSSSDLIDDFSGTSPAGTDGWQPYWDEGTTTQFDCYLDDGSLRIDFDVAAESWATCSLFYDSYRDWSQFQGIAFSYRADGPGRVFDVTVHGGTLEESTSYQYAVETMPGSDEAWITIELAWSQILGVDWEADARNPIDPSQITGVSFGFSTYEGTSNTGTLWIDGLRLLGEDSAPVTDYTPDEAEAPAEDSSDQPETESDAPSQGGGGLCPGSTALIGLSLAGIFILKRKYF
jgi:hypothetical protein